MELAPVPLFDGADRSREMLEVLPRRQVQNLKKNARVLVSRCVRPVASILEKSSRT